MIDKKMFCDVLEDIVHLLKEIGAGIEKQQAEEKDRLSKINAYITGLEEIIEIEGVHYRACHDQQKG